MATDTEVSVIERPELAEFRRQDVAIAKLAEDYLPLKVNGINDKKGLQVVHAARMDVKAKRVAVEKTRKDLKADALRFGQMVDAEAKRLTALIEPIEYHLASEEHKIQEEKDRIKKIEEDAKKAAWQKRIDAMTAVGAVFSPLDLRDMTETTFAQFLADATKAHAEKARKEAEEAEAKRLADEKAAAERANQEAELKAERERLAAIQREQEAERAKLREEREKIEREEATRRRAVELENAKREAAEKARVETERRLAEDASAEKAKAEALEAARLKAESERPYREQLQALAKRISDIEIPSGPADRQVDKALTTCAAKIREIAAGQL
jgi:hypothetical protein